jgi:hypothetical protein
MKSKEYQGIRSFGVISVFFMLGVCGLLSVPVWNSGSSEQQTKTSRRAEGLAYQILQARKEKPVAPLGNDRFPASEAEVVPTNHLQGASGTIGTDIWGKPFQFAVIDTISGQQKVLVWSTGPNGQIDTNIEKIDSERDNSVPIFGGDDVGVIVSVK